MNLRLKSRREAGCTSLILKRFDRLKLLAKCRRGASHGISRLPIATLSDRYDAGPFRSISDIGKLAAKVRNRFVPHLRREIYQKVRHSSGQEKINILGSCPRELRTS